MRPVIKRTGGYASNVAGRPSFNPFYVVLVIAGIAFAITACAYGVMTFVELRDSASAEGSSLVDFMESYGVVLMLGELAVLAVGTLGAIGTDRYWQQRAAGGHRPGSAPQAGSSSGQPNHE